MCFTYRLPVHAVAVILLSNRAESTIDTGYSNVPSVLTDVKARLQMMLRYGRALMLSRIAGQLLANRLMPREPAHALSGWHRSGRPALNAAGGQVRTSVKKVTLSAKLATAFGKLPVTAKKATEPHAKAMANDIRCHESSSLRNPKGGNVIRLSAPGTTEHWLAGHFDLEHLPSFEVDAQRAWPPVDLYNTAGKRGARRHAVEQSRHAIGNWDVRRVT
jgi:hypothetical protein